ncbi:MAG: hypothetical protein ACRDI1_08080 [Actinomycetota bacterium]
MNSPHFVQSPALERIRARRDEANAWHLAQISHSSRREREPGGTGKRRRPITAQFVSWIHASNTR